MGSEKDLESPHASVSATPNPKCRASGKRPGRISFHSLFHGKRSSRRTKSGAPSPSIVQQLHHHHQQLQQLLPTIPNMPSTLQHHPAPAVVPVSVQPTNTNASTSTNTTDATAVVVAASPYKPLASATAANPSSPTPSQALSSSRASLAVAGGGDPGEAGETELLECPLCLVRQPAQQLPALHGCGHRSCLGCLRQYLRIEITESRVQLSCPECAERLVPQQVADILQDAALLEKYEGFLLRRCLASDPDCRWCPAPDCG